MSGSGTIYTEQSVLGHTLGFAPMAFPAQVFVGLCSAAMPPSETVQGIEAFGNGYARMPATFALIATPANIAANVATVEYPQASGGWGTLGFFELWDAPAGGNRLYWGALIDTASQLPITITVASGDIVRFSAGTLAVQATTGAGGTSTVGAYLPLAGGTLTGSLLLASDPTTYLQAATKQYVDAHSGTGGGPGFLPLSGGTMLGPLGYTATGGSVSRSAQDRAADEVNILDFAGADRTGATDASAALTAALNTGKNVYCPAGTYRLNKAITVGSLSAAQRLRGDGLGTVFQIDQSFDPAATNGVFTLQGREQFAPTMQDMWISFLQPSGLSSRATMITLAAGGTSGTGGTGIQYPPAIYFGLSNRFRLLRLRVSGGWDGLIQGTSPSSTGGFWMEDIEMGCYSRGLSLGSNLDFSHIKGWHHWNFGQNSNQQAVAWDGNNYAMRFGQGAMTQSINLHNISIFRGTMTLENSGTSLFFSNLMMDGDNSTIQITDCQQVQISNLYFSCSNSGPNSALPSLNMMSPDGLVTISNIYGWPGTRSGSLIKQTGGFLQIRSGYLLSAGLNNQIVNQTGGLLWISGVDFGCTFGTWSVPPIHCSGGTIRFTDNNAGGASPTGQTFLQIDNDNANQIVTDNSLAPWATFVAPGTLGSYGNNGVFNCTIAAAGTQHFFGEQPYLRGTYNSGANLAVIAQIDNSGAVHLGGFTRAIIDAPIFDNAGVYIDATLNVPGVTSGGSLTIGNTTLTTLLNSAGTLSTFTVTMPASPLSGQMCRIATVNAITTFTVNGNTGQTVHNAPTTMAAGTSVLFVFTGSAWFRL